MKNLRHTARETLTDVTTASRRVTATSELATVALLAVTAVALLALAVATIALLSIKRAAK